MHFIAGAGSLSRSSLFCTAVQGGRDRRAKIHKLQHKSGHGIGSVWCGAQIANYTGETIEDPLQLNCPSLHEAIFPSLKGNEPLFLAGLPGNLSLVCDVLYCQ